MTSPHAIDREEVMACLDGELSPTRESEVRAHLESCESCRALAGDLTHLSATLGEWQIETPPARVDARVRDASRVVVPLPPAHSWRSWLSATGFAGVPRWAWVAGPAFVVLLLVVVSPRPLGSRGTPGSVEVSERNDAPSPSQFGRGGPGGGGGGSGGGRGGFDADRIAAAEPPGRPLRQIGNRSIPVSPSPPAAVTAPEPIQSEPPSPTGPMMARTVSISIVTDRVDDARAAIERVTTTFKGMVGSLEVSGEPPAPRSIRATLKIPADRIDNALADIRKLGKVRQESQSSEDIGDAHRDLVVRIANAKREEARLLDILSRRTDRVADVLEVEREASRVRGEIERMTAEELSMRTRVSYSTITVAIDEAYRAELQTAEQPLRVRLRNALVDGWRGATESVVAAVLTILVSGPTLIVWVLMLGLPGWAIWRLIRRLRLGSDLEMPHPGH